MGKCQSRDLTPASQKCPDGPQTQVVLGSMVLHLGRKVPLPHLGLGPEPSSGRRLGEGSLCLVLLEAPYPLPEGRPWGRELRWSWILVPPG